MRPDVSGETAGAPERRSAHWMAWLSGMVLLGAIVTVSLHFSEGREFLQIADRAEPWWLLVAIILQSATYLALGESWRAVARAVGFPLARSLVYRLSLAKLFVDQALPTGGISGTVVLARSLEDAGMTRAAVMAGVVINTAAYYAMYGFNLVAALLVTVSSRQVNGLIVLMALLFATFSLLFAILLLVRSGGASVRVPILQGTHVPAGLSQMLQAADTRLTRNRRLLLQAAACLSGKHLLAGCHLIGCAGPGDG